MAQNQTKLSSFYQFQKRSSHAQNACVNGNTDLEGKPRNIRQQYMSNRTSYYANQMKFMKTFQKKYIFHKCFVFMIKH